MEVVAPDAGELAARFGERPDTSARSVLVTIFGDSVVPTGGEIWLGELIELCAPFGFSERLVRTSMSRLTADGWFSTERVGRRSRYRLSAAATAAFAEAEARIYHRPHPTWDGSWTLVFTDRLDRLARERTERHLHTRGYVDVRASVLGRPHPDPTVLASLRSAGVDPDVAVATAHFADLGPLLDGAGPEGFGPPTVADRYHALCSGYGWAGGPAAEALDGRDAFLVRTMIVHELRRARLADPDLPAALLPVGWPRDRALDLAGAAYRRLSPATWPWLLTRNELARPPGHLCRFD